MGVEADDETLLRWRGLVPDVEHPFEPLRSMSYSVVPSHTGPDHVDVVEEGDALATDLDRATAVDAIYRRVFRRAFELASLTGWVRVHAVTADVAGRRVLLLGPSGVGKTTLALALATIDDGGSISVQGDESTMVRAGASVAVPRGFHVKAGTSDLIPSLADVISAAPVAVDVSVVDPHTIDPTWRLTNAPIDDVVVLEAAASGRATSTPLRREVDRSQVLQALVAESFVVTESKADLLSTVLAATASATCSVMARGPLDQMLDALRTPIR